MTTVLVCCGAGGVGKTTISAALGVQAALQNHRVAILTIDPAKRLADALDISLDNHPKEVPVRANGQLDALMLDSKETFDSMVKRFSPIQDQENILNNKYYQFVSTKLSGSHEYMAMVRLFELYVSGKYDLIVLDTPPTRHALDFLTAPERLSKVLDRKVVRLLARPGSKDSLVTTVLDKLIGLGTLGEISEFMAAFENTVDKISEEIAKINELLHSSNVQFYLVTTPDHSTWSEALEFTSALRRDRFFFHGFLVNQCTTPLPPLPEILQVPTGISKERWSEILNLMQNAEKTHISQLKAENIAISTLKQASASEVWKIPKLSGDIQSIDSLKELASLIPILNY